MKEEGQQDSKFLGGPIHVFDDHVEIGFRGFVWKILFRVEHEMKILETAQSTTLDHVHRYQVRGSVNLLQIYQQLLIFSDLGILNFSFPAPL
jgi:hypothetical protein